MAVIVPDFHSRFLREIGTSLRKRSRSIGRTGRFSLLARSENGYESLDLAWHTDDFITTMTVGDDHWLQVNMRRARKPDPGRTIFTVTGMRVLGDTDAIIKVFEDLNLVPYHADHRQAAIDCVREIVVWIQERPD